MGEKAGKIIGGQTHLNHRMLFLVAKMIGFRPGISQMLTIGTVVSFKCVTQTGDPFVVLEPEGQ